MTDTPIPRWAAKIGIEVQSEIARKEQLPATIIARAIMAADKAATEKERELAARIAETIYKTWTHEEHRTAKYIAAAIREGATHD